MKSLIPLLAFSLLPLPGFGQTGGAKEISYKEYEKAIDTKASKATPSRAADSADDTTPITNKINKGIDFGVSLGFNSAFQNLYEARISPLDNTLKISGVPTVAFMLSTGVSVPLFGSKCQMGGRYYRKLNSDGSETTTAYYVPYGLCALATVNLITFNSAATGSLYNQKLDGGLGLGYRLNDNVQIACSFEMTSYRLPQQFVLDAPRDKPLLDANGKTITAISTTDDTYYTSRYLPSVSLKLFYLFAYKPTNN